MLKEYEIFDTKRLRGAVHNGKICLDRKSIYNKPRDCPVQLPLPQTPQEIKEFVEAIEWLFTKEASEVSRHVDYSRFRTEYTQR